MELSTLNNRVSFESAANELLTELYHFIQKLHEIDLSDQKVVMECRNFSKKCQELATSKAPGVAREIKTRFEGLAQNFQSYSLQLESKGKIQELKKHWGQLAQSYEQASRELKKAKMAAIRHRRFKPINYYRNAYHVGNALAIYLLYLYVFPHYVGLSIMVLCSLAAIGAEILRRFNPGFNVFMVDKVFGKVSRPEEHFKINSATYYLISLTAMMLIAPTPAFLMALLTLGIGDPVANIMGKKFGRLKIYKEKSWVGSISFFISAVGICFLANFIHLMPEARMDQQLATSVWVALVGTLVELYSDQWDDNMTIIVACTFAAWAIL